MNNNPIIILFGTSDFSVQVFERLIEGDFVPILIVTEPDRPKGRGLELQAPAVKDWAEKKHIPIIQPVGKFDDYFVSSLERFKPDIFVVASYGKILPKKIIDIPRRGTLNVHPSLLPKYRGPSPIQSAILSDEKENGVTIMLMDEKIDHGPILYRKKIELSKWPLTSQELGKILGDTGGDLLTTIIPLWLKGEIDPLKQDDSIATFTKMIKKEDGRLNLNDDGYTNWLKFNAYKEWPGTFFTIEHSNRAIRVKISEAVYENGNFGIKKVVPEGKKEMSYDDFRRGYNYKISVRHSS